MENNKQQFSLRLTNEEYVKVEELKKFLNLTTNSSVIKYLICHYKDLQIRFDEEKKLCDKLNSNIKSMKNTIQTYFEAEKDFKKMFQKK
jgi:5-methylcytosine-specific restriction endonuclease McrBC GTP-binding regulatory subunit McrB